MKLVLKHIQITNFKGISDKKMVFDEKENFIASKNKGGKTTLSDAYHWLLTGKDSKDSVKFQIKPIIDGKQLERVDNIVEGCFLLNGHPLTLKRVNAEKWKRPRGSAEDVFDGNVTTYYWNEDVVTESVYLSKIAEIIDLTKLKLFSNVGYFNALGEPDRRAILVDMAGASDVGGLISTSKDYAFIGKFLDEKKTFKEFKAAVANNKKRTKEVLFTKDPAAKELEHQNTTLQMPFERIETDLKAAKLELLGIEKNINDKNEARREEDAKIEALRKEKYALENSAAAIKNGLETSIAIDSKQPDETKLKLQQEVSKDKKSIEAIDENISQLDSRLTNGTKTVEATQKELDAALALYDDVSTQWENENKSTIEFKEDDNICPTCQRPYEASNIAEKQKELVTRFNSNRRTALEALEKRGLALSKETIPKLKADIEKYNTGLSAIQIEIDAAKKSKDEIVAHLSGCELSLKNYVPAAKEIPSDAKLETLLLENKEYKDLLKKANDIQIKMDNVKSLDNSALIERKKELDSTIKEYEKDLLNKASISKNNKRIAEIRAEEKELNESLAELERQEYHMQQFVFKQMEDVQTKVNSMFNFVQFQMFDKQVNGEIIDACITLVDGKPIQKNAVNTAGEVNAGVDIINTLSKHYGVYLPMWVDNRESVTDLIPSETQVINLKVDPAYDTITLLP